MSATFGPDSVHSREDLGKALTELRLARDLSVRDVAAEADALLGTAAGWFAGQHAPTRASREMFERVLTVCGADGPAEREQWWAAVERVTKRRGRRRTRSASPYRGFDAFTADDADRFFGRDDVVDRMVRLVRKSLETVSAGEVGGERGLLERAVVVVGASGAGKSSLVRAGLVAQTRSGGALEEFSAAVLVPGEQPREALAAAAETLDDADGPSLIVVDQCEELWTQNGPEGRAEFLADLTDRFGGRPVVPVVALRADFYAPATEVPGLAEAFAQAQIVVPRMTEEQLREVIVRPAETVGASIDDDLVTLLLEDLRSPGSGGRIDAGVLPLLSHALRATWEHSDGRRLTVADYLKTGRIGGAVEQTAEEVYGDLPDDEQETARELLLAMINVDEETVTRRPLRTDALSGDAAHRVVESFAEARLFTLTDSQVQVTHEALLSAWPRLTGWIDADRERLLLQRRLRALSEPWEANGRPDDLLPGSARLEMFRPLVDGRDEAVIDRSGRRFLEAGYARVAANEAAERRRSRTLRTFAWSAAIFALVAVIAAVSAVVAGRSAVHQRNDAERSRNETLSRQLAIQAGQMADRDPYLAGQLAMIAYRQAPTVEARSTLIETMSRGVPNLFSGRGGSLLLARAGSLLAAASKSGQVRLFRIGADGIERRIGDFTATEHADDRLGGVALSPDGKTLYLGGRGRVDRWNVADPHAPVRERGLPGVRGDANALAISRDGRHLAAVQLGAGLQVWRQDGGAWRTVAVDGPTGDVAGAVAFSPDGRSLAVSSVHRHLNLWAVDGDRLRPTADVDLGWRDNQLAQGLVYSADGRQLFVALRSRSVDVYDVADPAAPRKVRQLDGHTSYVGELALSDDGTRIVSTGADNRILVHRLTGPAQAPEELATSVNSSSVVLVGDHLVVASDDGRVQDWPPVSDSFRVGPKTVFQIPFDPSSRRVLAADTQTDGRITQWRFGDAGPERAGPDLLPPPGVVFVGSVVQSPGGDTAVLGSVSGTVYFADFSDPSQPRIVGSATGHPGLNETVDYNVKSGLAVTGGTDQRRLTIMDAADPARPRIVGTFDPGAGVWWAALSPDGRRVAVATDDGAVKLVDLSDPARPRAHPDPLKFGGSALSVRFDGAGRRLVATSEDKTSVVVDVSDPDRPRKIATMSGPAGQLYSATFSRDGSRVLAGGANSEIWVWRIDGDDVREEAVLRSYPDTVYDVRFVGDDRILAAGAGGTVESWRLEAKGLVAEVCGPRGDQISRAEWATYVPGIPYDPPC
ncbi:MAG: hypothetical protein QM809_05805 [Gordonia sp. (in: high G+C Gram-positive bacteria)]|uniref:WD40 repeat domain-containing protein n=1 Tax=Gordonia sp. (in: high G+C Gram-positive bacteria) TaxID=84139 RepID=UPI0039E55BD5